MMNKRLIKVFFISSLIFSPQFSFGQSDSDESVEEMVVTATFRETTVMDTALSVDSVSQDKLDQLGADSLEEVFRSVSGLNLYSEGVGRSRIIIRGISGQASNYPGGQMGATTGVYIDDVPMSSVMSPEYASAGDAFDLQRIEVLKGPQGTLFGESSQGGTVRYIYNKPNPDEFESTVRMKGMSGADSSSSYRVDALINFPFSNDATDGAVRISGFQGKRGGYIDWITVDNNEPDWNDASTSGGRLSVLAETENLTFQYSSIFGNTNGNGNNMSYSPPTAANPFLDNKSIIPPYSAAGALAAGSYVGLAAPAAKYYVGANEVDSHTPGNDEEYQVHSFKFEVDTGVGTFSSITSYLDRYVQRRTPTNTEAAFVIDIYTGGLNVNFARGVFDSSGAENCFIPCNGAAFVPFFGEQNASFTNVFMAPFPDGGSVSSYNPKVSGATERVTQEFRFTSDATEDLFWVVGAFFKDTTDKRLTDLAITYFSPERAALGQATVDENGDPLPTESIGPSLKADFESPDTELQEISVYADITYEIDQNWSIAAGVRLTNLEKTLIIGASTYDFSEDNVSPRFNVSWNDGSNLVYLNASTGFRQGGVNGAQLYNLRNWAVFNEFTPGFIPQEKIDYANKVLTFDGDQLLNTELGYKGSFNDDTIQLILSVYSQSITDFAVYVEDYSLDAVGFPYIANIGDGSSSGAEMALNFLPTSELSIGIIASSNQTSVDTAYPGYDGSIKIAKDSKFLHAPETTYGFNIDYTHDIGNGNFGRLYLDHSFVGERFADSTNLITLGEYEVSNIRYSFIGANNITTTLFVNNLMDSIFVTNQRDFTFGFGGIGYDYGRPRELGISVQYNLN